VIAYVMAGVAVVVGAVLPLRWGVWGLLGACAVLFLVHAGVNTARGYEGIPFEETLLLFNDSWVSYVGYNLQITYRAFVLPVLGVAVPLVFRLRCAT
jgi:hypothetical protein